MSQENKLINSLDTTPYEDLTSQQQEALEIWYAEGIEI